MSKRFSIHDWQAKQRKQLLNEGVWEIGSKQDIQEFISKLRQLKNVYYNIVGSDDVQNGLDAALRAAGISAGSAVLGVGAVKIIKGVNNLV